ncbi:MAG TPA: PilC/PilY family type IV pilus protein [Patescibacteria group bacterium]|nr:PilC/PilY family type IV pilus protein [Patescibacteria group bacterium]
MKRNLTSWIVLACSLGVGGLAAQTLDLSKPPLFLNGAVDPNLMVTFDDSGSMGFGFTPDNVDNGGSRNCAWRYKRYYSAAYNKQYYNPAIVYPPPLKHDGSALANQSFGSASVNGFNSAASTIDLGSAYFVSWWEGHKGPRIAYSKSGTDVDCGQGDDDDKSYKFPTGSASAFYCTLNAGAPNLTDDSSYTCAAPTAAEQTNFANWFSYYRFRGNALKASVSRSFGALGEDLRVAWQNMNKNHLASDTDIGSFEGTRRENFFKWLYSSPLSGATPTLDSVVRAGDFFSRSGKSALNPYWDTTRERELMCRQNFHVLVTDGYWNQSEHPSASTPGASSILNSRTLPDGRAYVAGSSGTGAHSAYIWNEEKRLKGCSDDRVCTPSYSDLAFHYWATDLRTDLDDKVPAFLPNRSTGVTGGVVDTTSVADLRTIPEIYWNPENDPATWQHVVQYFIGFGVDGRLAYTDANYTGLRKGTVKWPYPRNNDAAGVDDSWHGALASRGKYFGASDPTQVADALSDILSSIVQRKGTSTAVAVSTGIIRSGTLAYQTQFDSTDWSGSVIARAVDANQNFGAPIWDAGCLLTGGDCLTTAQTGLTAPNWDTGRQILTSKAPTGSAGAAFRFSNLSTDQQAALNDNPATLVFDSDGKAAERLNYLRGERTRERSRGGSFRNRNSLFGAVVHSAAIVIGAPAKDEYDDTLWPAGSPEARAAIQYKDFAAANQNRATTVFVGANDGMLHALDARTGVERFAYVPHATYASLGKLTDPMYQFEPTVDNAVTVRDVYTSGAWRTLLIGTLRRGGQSVYALDVTSTDVLERNAGSVVQWEFSDRSTDGADLGYTYGQPFITRLANGKWVVLVPGSYNSAVADGAAGSGKAVLYVLDAETGVALHKFDLGAIDGNARGLAAPIAVDLQSDDIAEFAYAGDLAGNLWRFDLTSARPASWTASKLFAPTTPFERPITAQPRAERHPETKQPMVFVGTGKYIEKGDRTTSIPAQAFYGIIDDGSLVNQADLATRTTVSTGSLRRVSAAAASTSRAEKGWQIVFGESGYAGERVIAPATLRIVGRRVIFTTLIPSGDDPCLPGGTSFLMFADFANGGTAFDNYAFFDTNGDGEITGTDDATAVGKKINTMVPGVASILPPGGGVGGIVIPPSDGEGTPTTVKTREFEWRRRSFRDRTDLQGN